MTVYIIPEASSVSDEVQQMCTAAAVRFMAPSRLKDVVLAAEESGIVIVRVKDSMLRPLSAYVGELFDEIPFVVFRAPDSAYNTTWMQTFDTYPSVDWKELSAQLAKTGLLTSTTKAAQTANERKQPLIDRAMVQARSPKNDYIVKAATANDEGNDVDLDEDK